LTPSLDIVAQLADLACSMLVQLALAVAQSTAAQLTGRLPCRVAPRHQTRQDGRGTYTPSRTAPWRTRPCECERCQVVSCNRAAVWKVTCLCNGGGYLSHLLAAGGRSCCSWRESVHVLRSSLLALTLHHGDAACRAVLHPAAGWEWRSQATADSDGEQRCPVPTARPAPRQIEAISTMTFQRN
jgi:hypothetical protein